MTVPPPVWGFFGLFAGPWKFVIVAAVALVFYGRSFRKLSPHAACWLSPTNQRSGQQRPPSRWSFGDRVYLFLLVLAVTALATWIVTRLTIAQSGHGSG